MKGRNDGDCEVLFGRRSGVCPELNQWCWNFSRVRPCPLTLMRRSTQVVAAASTSWRDPPFLELYNVDSVSSDLHMPVLRNVGVPDYMKCLSWSKSFEGAEELGGIGGGLPDGSLCFWNTSKLLRSESMLHLQSRFYL